MIQLAMGHLGKGINALSDLGPVEDYVSLMYDIRLEAALADNFWGFANKTQELSRLPGEYINPDWKYTFQLPSDYLTANKVFETFPYIIEGRYLMANSQDVTLDYRYLPSNALFRADFIEYFTTSLAADLALPIAEKAEYIQVLTLRAEKARERAVSSSAKAAPNRPFRLNPMIAVR